MTLRTKFTLYLSFLIVLVVAIISSSIFVTQKSFLSDQFEENRSRVLKDFVYTCNESLFVKDEIQVFNSIKSLIKTHYPGIVYAGYISSSDTLFYASREQDSSVFKSRIFKSNSSSSCDFESPTAEKIREFVTPIYVQDQYVGTIRVGFSQSFLEGQISNGVYIIAKRIFVVAIISVVIGVLLANLLAFYINKPIHALAKAAENIGEGNLDTHVSINRQDELGKLGQMFNDMARKLKELDELKDGFVSSVSHELRSPLAAIDGYCDYLIEGLERKMTPDKQEKSLKIIKEATIRLTNFINNILDLAKIKAGRFEVRKMPVNISELSDDIVSLFVSLAAQQQKRLRAEIPVGLPSIDVDPEKIKQVITNLVGNALKFTQENDEIIVKARLAENGRFIEVCVSDSGIGIPSDALDHVFDKFYQVKESEMKKPKGTGLGLAIVAEIVRLHDGKIWVESTLGQGSDFKFTLPVWKHSR